MHIRSILLLAASLSYGTFFKAESDSKKMQNSMNDGCRSRCFPLQVLFSILRSIGLQFGWCGLLKHKKAIQYLSLVKQTCWSRHMYYSIYITIKLTLHMIFNSWHHLLKGKFLEGKHNCHMDHLMHTLVQDIVPFYRAKNSQKEWGFKGLDFEMK